MDNEIISIIIPVYNVESYLDRCVESVLAQSYQKLEIILVDDGSPDNCGMLCDKWAEKDSRIRVIHKENGGLSDARNAGLDTASGEYIVFVDSDDYIAADMVQNLYDTLKKHDADMCICNICYVDENGVPLPEMNQNSPIKDELLTGVEAIIRECDYATRKGWYYIFTWNKIYKKSLFSEVRFPKGKISEDDFTSHRVFMLCDRVACSSTVGYYYTQRSGSIVQSKSRLYFLHQAEGRLGRAIACEKLGLLRSAGLTYWRAAMALPFAFTKGHNSPQLDKELKETLQNFRRHIGLQRYCTLKEKLQVFLVFLSPKIYQRVFRNHLRLNIKLLLKRGSKNSIEYMLGD